ncbi:hypothetical protein [Pseudoxanthomonas daejeonensis]|uniref:hypothetical protein n=1 Tax=Pseudoxanthomonas daejeonensis TaxID=266062 RepID=UPI001391E59A|nr:hypothetical protein [Pseudoxanthomonas daejeonensis]
MNVVRRSFPALLLVACAAVSAQAQAWDGRSTPLGGAWKPIDPARLAEMRGGFQLPSGQMLSFGIERVVYVNDVLVASVSVRIPDVVDLDAGQAQALADFNKGIVVQVGEGNHFDPAGVAGGVVIQNTLDSQRIRTVTHVEVGTGALGVFQGINSYGALGDALARVPGPP